MKQVVVLMMAVALVACNAATDDSEPTPTPTPTPNTRSGLDAVFPKEAAVNSPFSETQAAQLATAAAIGDGFDDYQADVAAVLLGTTSVEDGFDAQQFLQLATDADCYGPQLKYSGHPDYESSMMGQSPDGDLPTGDLLLWQSTDSNGDACAVAQLNAQLKGVSAQTKMALISMAAMVQVIDDNSLSLPAQGATLDLTSQFSSAAPSSISVSNADLTQTADSQWHYTLEFSYTDTSDSSSHNIKVALFHDPGSDSENYEGVLNYYATGTLARSPGDSGDFPGGNCNDAGDAATLNGSLAYSRASDDMQVQSRTAILCGATSEGFVLSSSETDYRQVEADNAYNQSSNPDGWSENFSIFVGEYSLTDYAGSYAYVWQAGSGDSHSRTFNIGVNSATAATDGEAYAGYGNQVHLSEGEIEGMICNWAGPGNSHTPSNNNQRQFFNYNASTGNYDVAGEDIAYLPVVGCELSEGDSLTIDNDLDNELADETAYNTTDNTFTLDLMELYDGATTVAESIANRGFTMPSAVGGWPGAAP